MEDTSKFKLMEDELNILIWRGKNHHKYASGRKPQLYMLAAMVNHESETLGNKMNKLRFCQILYNGNLVTDGKNIPKIQG